MSVIKRNVAKIDTELTHQHEIAEIRVANKRKRLVRRLFFFSIIAFAIAYSIISILLSQSSSLAEKEAEKAKLKEEYVELKEEQSALKEEIIKLNDKEYISKLARRDYFLSDNNEIIFTIPDEKK